jgi:hypothetical protein
MRDIRAVLNEVTVRDLKKKSKVYTKIWCDTALLSFLFSDSFVRVVIQILSKDGYADLARKYRFPYMACPTRTVF